LWPGNRTTCVYKRWYILMVYLILANLDCKFDPRWLVAISIYEAYRTWLDHFSVKLKRRNKEWAYNIYNHFSRKVYHVVFFFIYYRPSLPAHAHCTCLVGSVFVDKFFRQINERRARQIRQKRDSNNKTFSNARFCK
jgi:hypothetical protein